MATKIGWVVNSDGSPGETWNPITGCSHCSAGCQNCYAEKFHHRLTRMGMKSYSNDFNKVTFHPELLDKPKKWKKPRTIFVCSMSDLFHPDIDDKDREKIFDVMHECKQHKFLILTKRVPAMAKYFITHRVFSNIGVGCTIESIEQFDRCSAMLDIHARFKFMSIEPMLSYMPDIPHVKQFDWIIAGGERCKNPRKTRLAWFDRLIQICKDENISFFWKQTGTLHNDDKWDVPDDVILSHRTFPRWMEVKNE